MGPELEKSVADVLTPETKNYEMLSDTDFKVLPSRKSDDLRDPYMWLDVRNAEVFIDALYTQIEAIDPKNKQIFMKNRDALKYKVAALDRKFEFGFRGIAAGISWMYRRLPLKVHRSKLEISDIITRWRKSNEKVKIQREQNRQPA